MQKNISLKNYTTFKIGGKAKYFLEVNNQEEIISAIKWLKQKNMPFFVLGGGSNVLINDKKYKGLVIKVQSSKFKVQSDIIEVEAGVLLGKLVGIALQNNLTGIEWAIGIPGTIGGAIYGNAGAFSKSIGDNIEEVEALEIQNSKCKSQNCNSKIKSFKKEECDFGYRESIFSARGGSASGGKRNKNLIILSVKIKLQKGDKTEIEKKMADFFKIKKQTQPLEFFSAGSIFKNPDNHFAAELIEKAGLKGKRVGGAEISQKHSNFIVNNGRAKAKDVKELIDLIKKQVKKKFNIILEEEIKYFNF